MQARALTQITCKYSVRQWDSETFSVILNRTVILMLSDLQVCCCWCCVVRSWACFKCYFMNSKIYLCIDMFSNLMLSIAGAHAASVAAAKRYLTCEGHTSHLTCGNGLLSSLVFYHCWFQMPETIKPMLNCCSLTDYGYIKVFSANYGRTDKGTCSDRQSHQHISNVHCFQQKSLSIMSNRWAHVCGYRREI